MWSATLLLKLDFIHCLFDLDDISIPLNIYYLS